MKPNRILGVSFGAIGLIWLIASALGGKESSETEKQSFEISGFTLGMDFNSPQIQSCVNKDRGDGFGVHCIIDSNTSIDLISSGKGLNVLANVNRGTRYPGGLGENSPLREELIKKYGTPRVDETEADSVSMIWGDDNSEHLMALSRGDYTELIATNGALVMQDQNALTMAAQQNTPVPKL